MFTGTVRETSFISLVLLTGVLLPFPGHTLHAQISGSLAGTVLDATNDSPLRGVTVTMLGENFQAVTNEGGEFFFAELQDDEVMLRAELSGYASMVELVSLTTAEEGVLQLRLIPIVETLSELLVEVGAGSPSGSADVVVSGDDDTSRTALDLLADRIPGLTVSQSTMSSGTTIRIRGTGSISLSNSPSIYVDGIRVSARETSPSLRWSAGLHTLELIPASRVKRIRVLRGPSASVMYEDAAHGVIVVETHDGRTRPSGNPNP